MKKVLFALLFMVVSMTMMAVPAKKGQWKTLKLANGTEVRAMLVGDEHGHYWKAADGKAYMQQGDAAFYQEIDAKAVTEKAKARRNKVNAKRVKHMAARRVGEVGSYTGKKKAIMLLVNFTDKSFATGHDNTLFNRIANEEGFSEGSFKGSMADYFKAQSRGQFELDFDVVGPLQVSNKASYYGANDKEGNDKFPGKMVCEAIALAKNQVSDWTQYDWDGDGYVDQVYVVYAGQGEADGGAANTIWPHAYSLTAAAQYGDGDGPVTVGTGLKVDSYACGSELNGSKKIEGIGTMCHEYSHCLGYPDFYDIDYSGGQGMGPWDLMDSGSYNDDGYQPAGYTSYERWMAGWLTPITLETENVAVENMKSLQNDGESYVIYNKGNRNEYLLLENRQLEGWDASLPSAGLLILHCDYDATVWEQNGPNDDPNHQRMTVVPADGHYDKKLDYYSGQYYFEEEDIANDPFPYGSVKAFNKDFKTYDNIAKKAAQFFNKNTNGTYWIDSSVENIKQNADKTVSFNFVSAEGGSVTPDPQPTPEGVIFYESFDKCDGKGGNSGDWSGQVGSGEFTPDHDGWEVVGNKAWGGDKCAKFGVSPKSTTPVAGSATTPAIALDGTATLTFKAGAWNAKDDGTGLTLSVDGGTIDTENVTMEKGAFNEYTATVTGSGSIRITFAAVKGRFFLDEVMLAGSTSDINIQNVNDQRVTKTIYTIDGRYVGTDFSTLSRGLYIVNGKKVVIK